MLSIDPIRRMDDQSIIRYSQKFTVPLPDAFIEANNLQPRDEMEIYRDRVNGRDALIIIAKKSVPLVEEVNSLSTQNSQS